MPFPTSLNNANAAHTSGQMITAADEDVQSADINALGVKLGSGSSVPSTVGNVLTVTAAGASAWQPATGTAGPTPLSQTAAKFGDPGYPYAATMPTEAGLAELGSTSAIQTLINAASAGTSTNPTLVSVPPGIYRGPALTFSNAWVTVQGYDKVVIAGSDIWAGWAGSAPYTSTLSATNFVDTSTFVLTAFIANHCNLVFRDRVRLTQVASAATLATGQWQFVNDASDFHIKLFDTPVGHTMEVTTRGTGTATVATQGITLQGIQFRDFPTQQINSAVVKMTGNNCTIRHCVFSWTHGLAVNFASCNDGLVEDCYFHDVGVAGCQPASTVRFIFRRNVGWNFAQDWSGYDPYWASGLIKLTGGTGGLIQGNVGWNGGYAGAWVDVDAMHVAVWDNYFWDCRFSAIVYEVSEFGSIKRNRVYTTVNWPWGTTKVDYLPLYIRASRTCEVANNIVVHTNPSGTAPIGSGGLCKLLWVFWENNVSRADLPSYPAGTPAPGKNNVHDNILVGIPGGMFLEAWEDGSSASATWNVGNISKNNIYGWPGATNAAGTWVVTEPTNRFAVAGSTNYNYGDLAGWNGAASWITGGTYMTEADRLAYDELGSH